MLCMLWNGTWQGAIVILNNISCLALWFFLDLKTTKRGGYFCSSNTPAARLQTHPVLLAISAEPRWLQNSHQDSRWFHPVDNKGTSFGDKSEFEFEFESEFEFEFAAPPREHVARLEAILRKFTGGDCIRSRFFPPELWDLISGTRDCHHHARVEMGVGHLPAASCALAFQTQPTQFCPLASLSSPLA